MCELMDISSCAGNVLTQSDSHDNSESVFEKKVFAQLSFTGWVGC